MVRTLKNKTKKTIYTMSIQIEIDRLKKAKSDIKTAIINKGGTISDTATIDTYASAIDGISVGGGRSDRVIWTYEQFDS